ncbi:hypothetical protein J4G07_22120 [Candidatus Poribacteria bacterium]|nr:hypothetical protein [Candidatus Poribacteria bacterium]
MGLTIKSVNIINLKRRTDLQIAQRAVWNAMGATPAQVVFHDAMDGMKYDSKASIISAAKADGFDFFEYHDGIDEHWQGVVDLTTFAAYR